MTTEDLDTIETAPLIPKEKGHCWACWEEKESKYNPLVRVCSHCKDPDLQFIHQQCVDKYINALPAPRRPLTVTDEVRQYYCTRCRDPYNVQMKPVHPLVVIWNDLFLRATMVLLTLSMFTLVVSSSVILAQHWNWTDIAFDFWDVIKIPYSVFAIVLLALSMVAGGITWSMVWEFSSGHITKTVIPINDEA